MSVEVGQQAPDFTLYNTEQKEISLKDLRSKSNVVILFFPLSFTGVCTPGLETGHFFVARSGPKRPEYSRSPPSLTQL
jgi:alkyl hydroperoxide reductase subunit AhpC